MTGAAALLQPAVEGMQWVTLHTKPRCEKKLQLLARTRDCQTFLPCIERVHNYGNRQREFSVPMFTGYLFACVRSEDLVWFRQNPHVANLIEVVGEAQFLEPLRAVADALEGGVPVEVLPYLQPGNPVRITGGPMKGLEAVVAEVKGDNKVVLQFEMIQQSVAMEIPVAYLKSLS